VNGLPFPHQRLVLSSLVSATSTGTKRSPPNAALPAQSLGVFTAVVAASIFFGVSLCNCRRCANVTTDTVLVRSWTSIGQLYDFGTISHLLLILIVGTWNFCDPICIHRTSDEPRIAYFLHFNK